MYGALELRYLYADPSRHLKGEIMEKRYQVFVSSTYTDLKDARREVVQALLEMNCIPAGMELFPAADEEQLKFIQRVIDDCDYYILILAGRYGSVDAEGVSYTEREFDYAVKQGIPVMAFVHSNPATLPAAEQGDTDPERLARLAAFREKVQTGRIVKPWTMTSQLAGLVALSLPHTIKTKPRPGWIRGVGDDPAALLEQINDLRKRNDQLVEERAAMSRATTAPVLNLAPLSDRFHLAGTYLLSNNHSGDWKIDWTWERIFSAIAPDLLTWTNEGMVSLSLAKSAICASRGYTTVMVASVQTEMFKSVKVQLMALGLVDVQPQTTVSKTVALFWALTPKGRELLMQVRTVKAQEERNAPPLAGLGGLPEGTI